MSAVCPAVTRSGSRCTQSVRGPSGYCHLHDPARAEERRRAASRAGKSKPSREIVALKVRISEVVDAVLDGRQDRGRGAVAIQGLNALRAVLALEREIRQQDDLEARLEALEAAEGAGSWAG